MNKLKIILLCGTVAYLTFALVVTLTFTEPLLPREDRQISVPIEFIPKLLDALVTVESSNNPLAHNSSSGARGLTQITPVAWADLVNWHPERYSNLDYKRDIFNPDVARQAGFDYLNIVRRYLEHYDMPVTLPNLLAAYNWGIGNLRNHRLENAPEETINYITKIADLLGISREGKSS